MINHCNNVGAVGAGQVPRARRSPSPSRYHHQAHTIYEAADATVLSQTVQDQAVLRGIIRGIRRASLESPPLLASSS
eukprot:1623231-Pleurochrysis_carterae.AAC.1